MSTATRSRSTLRVWVVALTLLGVAMAATAQGWFDERGRDGAIVKFFLTGFADEVAVTHDGPGYKVTENVVPPWRSAPYRVTSGTRVTVTASRRGTAQIQVSIIQDDVEVAITQPFTGPGATGVSWVVR